MRRGHRAPHRSLDPGAGLTEEFVEIDDSRRMRVVRAGASDGPLVVLEAGMGSTAEVYERISRARDVPR